MNILFLTKSFGIGGVEVVTMTLAKTFAKHGHQVGIFSFYRADDILEKQLPKDIPLYIAHGYKNSRENISMLRQLLVDKKIEVVINQWGLPFLPIRVINQARKGLKVKVISVYHNQVDTNGKLKACDQAIERCQNPLLRSVLEVKRFLVKSITSYSMRYVYKHSDVYEVLSPSFIELFKKFTGIKNPTKLVAQTNPITIDGSVQSEKITNVDKKEKEIIYVGRLDFVQKRVYRVIDTWNYLEERFPDWRLTIVGDGEDRENLENHVRCLGLKRVSFEGFQKPIDYYKRASMLLLTSDFEGFPLVLAECMSFGVIPAVYNSYSAVGDIIDDGKDGVIIPYHKDGYQAEEAANMIAPIMKDDAKREQMALAAMEKSKEYSVERIYDEWRKILGLK